MGEHCSESVRDHLNALAADFEPINNFLETMENRSDRLPKWLSRLVSQGISEGIAEAASSELHLNLSSEFHKQLLEGFIFERVTIQAAAKACKRIPVRRVKKFAKSYKCHWPKIIACGMALINQTQQCDGEGEEEDEAERVDEADEVDDVDEEDGADWEDVGAEEEDGAEEQEPEENVMTNTNDEPSMPQEQSVNIAYDPEREPGQCEPLAHTSPVTFKINSQAAVNVLYDMSPSLMRNAVCVAIQKKLTPQRKFLGASYLSNVRLSKHGHVCATPHNEKREDAVLLFQMSSWDRDIIDHDVGINFGTTWRYRVHLKGFKKESSQGGPNLGLRKQKAALISELVRTNITTLTSLRIHHIKDVRYSLDSDAEEALAVDFYDIDQARAALSQGLCYKGVHYQCETLEPHHLLERCKHCQAVGHPSYRTYCGPPRCGSCSGSHSTSLCPNSSHERCPLCGGPHASDNLDCPLTKAETNSVRFTTVSSRKPQLMIPPETAGPVVVSQRPALPINGGLDSDTPNLLSGIGHPRQSIKEPNASVKAQHWSDKGTNTKKRRPLGPLMSGALNDAGRSPKRIKSEEQQETDDNDLYSRDW